MLLEDFILMFNVVYLVLVNFTNVNFKIGPAYTQGFIQLAARALTMYSTFPNIIVIGLKEYCYLWHRVNVLHFVLLHGALDT